MLCNERRSHCAELKGKTRIAAKMLLLLFDIEIKNPSKNSADLIQLPVERSALSTLKQGVCRRTFEWTLTFRHCDDPRDLCSPCLDFSVGRFLFIGILLAALALLNSSAYSCSRDFRICLVNSFIVLAMIVNVFVFLRQLLARVSVTGLEVPVMRIPYRSGFLPTGSLWCCNSCKRRRTDTV